MTLVRLDISDLPDPVKVTGYRWFREDGTEITQSAGHP